MLPQPVCYADKVVVYAPPQSVIPTTTSVDRITSMKYIYEVHLRSTTINDLRWSTLITNYCII